MENGTESGLCITRMERLKGKDTTHQLIQKVTYKIGSGHHTNSHLFEVNGYVHQMPYTYYTQGKIADLPPGFEKGNNTRFSREIGIECMSCHNAYPQHTKGSLNKYERIPSGIDCYALENNIVAY